MTIVYCLVRGPGFTTQQIFACNFESHCILNETKCGPSTFLSVGESKVRVPMRLRIKTSNKTCAAASMGFSVISRVILDFADWVSELIVCLAIPFSSIVAREAVGRLYRPLPCGLIKRFLFVNLLAKRDASAKPLHRWNILSLGACAPRIDAFWVLVVKSMS